MNRESGIDTGNILPFMKRKAHKARKAYRNSTIGRLNADRIRHEAFDTNPKMWVRRRKHWADVEVVAKSIDDRIRELRNWQRSSEVRGPEPVLQMHRTRPKRLPR